MISSESQNHVSFSLSDKEIIRLGEWEEYVGVLRDIMIHDGIILLEFDDCCIQLYGDLDVEKYIGKRIGILRTDIKGREVLIRKI